MAGSLYQTSLRRYDDSKDKTRSVYDKLAYRAGTNLTNPVTGELHKYPREDVTASGVVSPEKWTQDPSNLAFAIQYSERGKNARIGRDYVGLLPDKDEFTDEQRLKVTAAFAERLSKEYKVPVAFGVHTPEPGRAINYHAHFFVPTRQITEHGFGWKARYELTREERRSRGLEGSARTEFRNIQSMFKDELENAYEDFGIQRKKPERGESAVQAEAPEKAELSPAAYAKAMFREAKNSLRLMTRTIKTFQKIVGRAQAGHSQPDNPDQLYIPLADQKLLAKAFGASNKALLNQRKVNSQAAESVGLDVDKDIRGDRNIGAEISPSAYQRHRDEKVALAPQARLKLKALSTLNSTELASQEKRQDRIGQQEDKIGGREPVIAASVRNFWAQLRKDKDAKASQVVAQTRTQLVSDVKRGDYDR